MSEKTLSTQPTLRFLKLVGRSTGDIYINADCIASVQHERELREIHILHDCGAQTILKHSRDRAAYFQFLAWVEANSETIEGVEIPGGDDTPSSSERVPIIGAH